MFKKIIIYTLNYNIKNCFVGMKYYNLTIKGFIYKHTLCLLGLKIK